MAGCIGGDGAGRRWNWVCSVVGQLCRLAALCVALALLGDPLLGLRAKVGGSAIESAAGGGLVTLEALHGGLVIGTEEAGEWSGDGLILEGGVDEHGGPLLDASEFPGGVGSFIEEKIVDGALGVEALAELVAEKVPVGGIFAGKEDIAGGEAMGHGIPRDFGFSFLGYRAGTVLRVGAIGG